MAERLERHEITPGAASEVKQFKRRRRLNVLQQRADVLTDIVITRALPEVLRVLVVVLQRSRG